MKRLTCSTVKKANSCIKCKVLIDQPRSKLTPLPKVCANCSNKCIWISK